MKSVDRRWREGWEKLAAVIVISVSSGQTVRVRRRAKEVWVRRSKAKEYSPVSLRVYRVRAITTAISRKKVAMRGCSVGGARCSVSYPLSHFILNVTQ